MSSWTGVGVMSGSSLDGLDLCYVEFTGDYTTDTWSHRILQASTEPYDPVWTNRLRTADKISGEQLAKLHADYAHLTAGYVSKFIAENNLQPNFVASHGHTVFHQPENNFTFQLGDGETMASKLQCPVVCNFRNKDVALGGQGAPLVPVGETYLFSQYDMCLNLGGIANISVGNRGFDISPCNMMLNYLANKYDSALDYDEDGEIARRGTLIDPVEDALNSLPYYSKNPPKSLGKEWFDEQVLPIIESKTYKPEDLLRTAVEHISTQIVNTLLKELASEQTKGTKSQNKTLLVTGGGAFNSFLMERMRSRIENGGLNVTVTECDKDTLQFKEALIFAFLGLRCLLGLPNVSKSVTGSKMDSVSGSIHLPPTNAPFATSASKDYRFHFRSAVVQGNVPPLKKRSPTHETGSG